MIEFGVAESNLGDDLFPEGRSMMEMGVEPMKDQFVNLADGIDFEVAFAGKNEVRIEDIFVTTIGKRDLIKNKIASGRHKDLADVERLEPMD